MDDLTACLEGRDKELLEVGGEVQRALVKEVEENGVKLSLRNE